MTMDAFFNIITGLAFAPALVITIFVFLSDTVVGLIAAKASGRHIKSSIMVACQDKKMQSFFKYVMMGVGFFFAGELSGGSNPDVHDALHVIATIIVIIPALPEIISVSENMKIIKSKTDTKPKE